MLLCGALVAGAEANFAAAAVVASVVVEDASITPSTVLKRAKHHQWALHNQQRVKKSSGVPFD